MSLNSRKALVGYSSPIGYYYNFERERGNPCSIVEAPLSLLVLYDEIWFMSRDLCPYNLIDLTYVHFVDEELFPEGLPADFSKGLESPNEIKDFPWDYWKSSVENSFVSEARFDNHARGRLFGELSILPTPGSYDNFLVDYYVAEKFGLELVENSVNSLWMTSFAKSMLSMQTSEHLLMPKLPSFQSLEGPYHPFIEDLRKDGLIYSYRQKMIEISRDSNFEGLTELKLKLDLEYQRIVAELAVGEFSNKRIVDGAASLTVGQVPIISNIVSGIQGINTLRNAYKNKKNNSWAGFIARTISSANNNL
jgi:hypothetical protein